MTKRFDYRKESEPSRSKMARAKGVPSYHTLTKEFNEEEAAVDYLLLHKILEIPKCPECKRYCTRRANTFIYRCHTHSYSACLMGDTFLANVHLPKNQALHLMYCWIIRMSHLSIVQCTGVCADTATQWLRYCRQLVTQYVVRPEGDNMIGGIGRTVQIDESKFGKRKKTKNGRGHRVEGAWVFGGVEKNGGNFDNNKYFCVVVEDRKASTLIPLIQQ